MVSRQLRKLRQQQDLLNIQNEAAEQSEESEDEPVVAKPRGNMFSGFAALGDTGADDDEDDDDMKSEQEEAAPQKVLEQSTGGQDESAKKSKKSKKKKKKGKKAESPAVVEEKSEDIDEIDKVLEELKLEAQKQGGPTTSPTAADKPTSGLNKLLSINFHHLKAMNEMRRVFGKAMDVAEVEERTQQPRHQALPQNLDLETFLSARAAYPAQGRTKTRGMFDTILRTNPFVEGKKSWPRGSAQGLKMVRVTEGTEGEVEYTFAHDKEYDALEGSFFGLVQMYDPMQIVYFLHRNPYHISSLIQVSKVARQDQNSALAADLIERALFTFGRASLSEFRKNLEKGLARIDFARPENRQFYLAGYNLIQKLVMKGTYRTALEWAKLFLSINHSDPYGMITWIHALAIRAWEAKWFIDFCATSLPAATSLYPKHTLPLAHLQLDDLPTATSILTKNMHSLPWLYCALFSALNLDTPPQIWGIQPRTPDEDLHVQLYIHTAKDLWNSPNAISLLKSASLLLPPSPALLNLAPTLPHSPLIDLPLARLTYLDNVPALMSLVPRQILHTASPNFDFDPLPPPKLANLFSSTTQQLPWYVTEQQQANQRRTDGTLREAAQRMLAQMRRELDALPEEADEDRLAAMTEARRRLGEQGVGREMLNEMFREVLGLQEDRGDDEPWDGQETEGERDGRGREGQRERQGEGPRLNPAAPGFVNYLLSLFPRDGPQLGEDWADTVGRMPGGWGDEDDGEEEDDWGVDQFEEMDDFEGDDDEEGEERR